MTHRIYEIVAKDSMIDRLMTIKFESSKDMLKEDIIGKYHLNSPDIVWFKLYEIIDGEKKLM